MSALEISTDGDLQSAPTRVPTLQLPPSPLEPLEPLDEPPQIGRYRLLDRLGKGGMGVVYSAHDPELDRVVAIKLMVGDRDDARAHRVQDILRREAQALAKLAHPNIVAIYDVGVHAGQVFVAMEFVAGRTMREWWEERSPGWQEVLAAMVQAGRGIVAAHAVGLVHRDIKPDNLLMGDDGRVRVADFGIARHAATALETVPTGVGAAPRPGTLASFGRFMGTPGYMPPEQHEGGAIGPHCDQFSFCVTLWEGLYGRRPFIGDPWRLPELIRADEPSPPAGAPQLPAWLDRAVRRGLAPDPADRWPSMQALLDVLALDFDARRARRRRRALSWALALVGAVALALGGRTIRDGLARQAGEQAAALRLAGVDASVARLLARGQRGEAEQLVQTFVQEPELRETQAALDAWLMWADHMDGLGDRAAVQAAVVEAYAALPEGDRREPALALRIARQFRGGWKFDELATLGEQVAGRWPEAARGAVWAELRAEAALARGDIDGFLALAPDVADGKYDDVVPVLRALATYRCPVRGDMSIYPVDWPGGPGPEVVIYEREYVSDRPRDQSLRRMDPDLTRIDVPIDAPLWISDAHPRPLQRVPGGVDHLIAYHREAPTEIRLHELGADGTRELLRWRDDTPTASAAADLDGDGVRELYLGTSTYTRKLYRLEPDAQGAWQRRPAHPPTDAIHSDIRALVAGDFDGDGREELVAAVGAWRAYDLRVLEADPAGELRLVARRRFGHVTKVAPLRAVDGATLLVLAKDETAPSKDAWPPGEPQGVAPGLHVVRRRGAELEPVAHVPWIERETWQHRQHADSLHIGDFDGDGLEDIAVALAVGFPHAALLLVRQLADGRFASVVLGRLLPLHAGDFDDDPDDEIAVTYDPGDGRRLCVLGVPGPALAAAPARHRVAENPALGDPLLARAWTRTESLAALGLYGEAARALERRIALTEHEPDRLALRRRAAALYEAADDSVRAGERFEELADEGDRGAALRAVANYEQGLRMADALRVAEAALRIGDLTAAQADELRHARDRLAALERREARVELAFDAPLDPRWQIHEPLMLRSDLVRDQLVVDTTADTRTIAALPVVLTGEPLTLEFEVDIDRAEWGTQLGASLRSPADELVAELMVSAGGGGGYLQRQDVFGPFWVFGRRDTPSPAEASRHRMHTLLLPSHQRAHIVETGDRPEELRILLDRPYGAGPHALELRSVGLADLAGQQIRGGIRRLALLGASLSPGPASATARDVVAHALVAGDWRAVLAVSDDGSPELRLARGVAFGELGRAAEAASAFAALDPEDAALRRRLCHLLRTRLSTFAPILRVALAPQYPSILLEALTKHGEYPDPALASLRLAALVDLEGLPPARDPAELKTRAGLLALRGGVWRSAGELARAEADLAAAVELLERAALDRDAPDAELAALELQRAEVAARAGRPDDAFAAAVRALRRATDLAWTAARLRISPDLAPFQSEPRWRALVAAHL